ncbi:polysaccharide deacetylase family protein [Pararhodobacter zhoushanensis]|uniref:Chitooligosaccharide deacetylase n=1 Tax=Pararhodobacter zhoushanensis TaxID=2479545 RepID=A0ABT3GYT5_9RHOB|nr:polysaccharide deacetylase family protein [Pararhodobacter zhoushanensis]MCW1932688.1 polysaccharide deacetylase family protein [Pararhodobacter zhoushanensis]
MRRLLALLLILTLAAAGLWQLSRARSFQLFGAMVDRVETTQPLVALTFDDGPVPVQTEAILGILAGRSLRATFFVTGREAEANPMLTAALVAAGHDLGNHSYSHTRMVLVRPAFVERELARTDAAIRAAGYTGPIHFRPPYGKRLFVLPWVLAEQNRTTVMWDIEPDSDLNAGAERIARIAIEQARPGSIILLHAMASSRSATRAALPLIIDGLHARGFRLVTLSELLAATP